MSLAADSSSLVEQSSDPGQDMQPGYREERKQREIKTGVVSKSSADLIGEFIFIIHPK